MARLSAVARWEDRGLALVRRDHRTHGLRRDKRHVAGHHQDRVALGLCDAFLYRAKHAARRVRVLDGTHAWIEHRVDVTLELGSAILSDNDDDFGDAAIEKGVDRVIEE